MLTKMRNILKLSFAAVLAAALVSCSDSGLEKRIAELENRVQALEGGKVASRATTTPATTVAQAGVTANEEAAQEGPFAAFKFEGSHHDFGTINEGDVVTHIFKFTNTGEVPLIIKDAKGSCGCTVPNPPKEPIAVGETGEIEVKFNSNGKPNVQNKTVTITANTNPATTRLTIKATVTPKSAAN